MNGWLLSDGGIKYNVLLLGGGQVQIEDWTNWEDLAHFLMEDDKVLGTFSIPLDLEEFIVETKEMGESDDMWEFRAAFINERL